MVTVQLLLIMTVFPHLSQWPCLPLAPQGRGVCEQVAVCRRCWSGRPWHVPVCSAGRRTTIYGCDELAGNCRGSMWVLVSSLQIQPVGHRVFSYDMFWFGKCSSLLIQILHLVECNMEIYCLEIDIAWFIAKQIAGNGYWRGKASAVSQ